MIRRRRFHRAVFVAAGCDNLAWGAGSALDPQWLFRYAGLPPLNQPAVFACLAMVIGLYGILDLEVARVPEPGWLLAAVGLAGKILGPIGLTVLLVRGLWPMSTLLICIPLSASSPFPSPGAPTIAVLDLPAGGWYGTIPRHRPAT